MGKKQQLTNALQTLTEEIGAIETEIAVPDRTSSGDYEQWGPKDFLAHAAEWTKRRVLLLSRPQEAKSLEESGGIEKANRGYFDHHHDTPWADVVRMLQEAVRALRVEVEQRDEVQLAAPDPTADNGSGVWRGIAFYGIVHPVSHMVQALVRAGSSNAAVQLQERMNSVLLAIDSSDSWKAVIQYNHARALTLAANPAALEIAREAIAHNPDVLLWIARDPDFVAIRDAVAPNSG